MTDLDLDVIEARANAATARPWDHKGWHRSPHGESYAVWRGKPEGSYPIAQTERGLQGWHDAEFIAHAREDVPRLVAEVRRLRANQWPEWSQMLTNQSCEKGKHPDWFVDSEHSHRCPWCALDAARAEAERQRERADHNAAAVNENADEIVRLRAEAARVREALQAVRSPEAIERAAEALYEEGRPDTYTDEEWDWPNIDHAYDWDGDHDERGNPEGQSPEWLRDRYRAEARAALDAALDGAE